MTPHDSRPASASTVRPEPASSDAGGALDRLVRQAARRFDAPFAALSVAGAAGAPRARFGASADPWLQAPPPAGAKVAAGAVFSGDADAAVRLGGGGSGFGFRAQAPLVDAAGRVIGMLRVADLRGHGRVTEDQRADLADLAALAATILGLESNVRQLTVQRAKDREWTQLALSAGRMAAFDWDLADDAVYASSTLHDLLGIPGDPLTPLTGQDLRATVHADDNDALRAAVKEGLREDGRYEREHRVVRASDGRTIWVSSAGVTAAQSGDETRRIIGLIYDITARKQSEEQHETLVAELDHRIKNVLASVQSLAAQSARKASSLEGFLKTFSGRLKSMASAHQLLTATRWRGAGLQSIAAAELGGLAPGQTRWEGPDILLNPRAANAMSLALHELATNAVKFGALSTESGRVEVSWRGLADGGLTLSWVEVGGPRVTAPTRRGFGSTLLEKVTGRELGGEVRIDFGGEGVRATIIAGPSALSEATEQPEAAPPAPLPANLVGASAGDPLASQAAHVRGLRVLIVEDALLLALELESGLQEAGAVIVGSAADLQEAMGMVDLPIDAAVLDANLNGISVLPVAEALAKRGVPFVFATGYGDNKLGPQGFGAPVIRKPYDVTQVAAALAEVTGRV